MIWLYNICDCFICKGCAANNVAFYGQIYCINVAPIGKKRQKNVLEVNKNNRHLYLNEERKDAGWLYAANCLALL